MRSIDQSIIYKVTLEQTTLLLNSSSQSVNQPFTYSLQKPFTRVGGAAAACFEFFFRVFLINLDFEDETNFKLPNYDKKNGKY